MCVLAFLVLIVMFDELSEQPLEMIKLDQYQVLGSQEIKKQK